MFGIHMMSPVIQTPYRSAVMSWFTITTARKHHSPGISFNSRGCSKCLVLLCLFSLISLQSFIEISPERLWMTDELAFGWKDWWFMCIHLLATYATCLHAIKSSAVTSLSVLLCANYSSIQLQHHFNNYVYKQG